jgi:hypothetical protein
VPGIAGEPTRAWARQAAHIERKAEDAAFEGSRAGGIRRGRGGGESESSSPRTAPAGQPWSWANGFCCACTAADKAAVSTSQSRGILGEQAWTPPEQDARRRAPALKLKRLPRHRSLGCKRMRHPIPSPLPEPEVCDSWRTLGPEPDGAEGHGAA